jgi:sugar phosphate isomerase/epimerase
MRFAFSTLGCPEWSLEETVQQAKAIGYDGIELRLIDGEVIPPDPGPAQTARVRSVTTDAGCPVVALDTSVRLTAPDAAATRADILAYIQLAAEWGAPVIRVFGGDLPPDPAEREAALAGAADLLAGVATPAVAAGVTVAVETHDDFSSSSLLADLLARVPVPGIGAVWDSHHPYRLGETAAEVAANIGSRVALAQVKDAVRDPSEATGWRLVLLGEGEVPVEDVARLAREHGLEWISVEWEKKWHPEIEPPEIALPQHLAVLRGWHLDDVNPPAEEHA